MQMSDGWIGVDLDGTLAYYEKGDYHKKGPTFIGEPIPKMVERVKKWLEEGMEVRIMTARALPPMAILSQLGVTAREYAKIEEAIAEWCLLHIGRVLPITCVKDYDMIELWDDRAVAVQTNTGKYLGGGRL